MPPFRRSSNTVGSSTHSCRITGHDLSQRRGKRRWPICVAVDSVRPANTGRVIVGASVALAIAILGCGRDKKTSSPNSSARNKAAVERGVTILAQEEIRRRRLSAVVTQVTCELRGNSSNSYYCSGNGGRGRSQCLIAFSGTFRLQANKPVGHFAKYDADC